MKRTKKGGGFHEEIERSSKMEEYNVPDWMTKPWDMDICVLDENGEAVVCPECGMDICLDGIAMVWKDGEAICPECGYRMSRQLFMKRMSPPSEECIGCKEIYPQCKARCDRIPEQYGDEFWEQRFDWY